MLATRIIPVVLARDHLVVKGKRFDNRRAVGQLRQAIRVYELRNVDELIVLDVGATPRGNGPDIPAIREYASELFCPVTIGGGISTLTEVRDLLANGADKVAINTAAVRRPTLIAEVAAKFGRQAVVISIDAGDDDKVYTHCGQLRTSLNVVDWAQEAETLGAGELLLNCISCDGQQCGYNIPLVKAVAAAVSIPVVACGGAGSYADLRTAYLAGAHAVAAGAMWLFTDATPAGAADYLAGHGIPVRRTKRNDG